MKTIIRFALATIALAAPVATSAQPSDPAERLLRGLITALSSADSATIGRFVRESFMLEGPNIPTAEQRVERLMAIAANWGSLTITSIEPRKGVEVAALVRAGRTEAMRRLAINYDTTTQRIRFVSASPARGTDASLRLTEKQAADSLRAYVERLAGRDVFSGTVLLAKAGVPIYRAAFGEANKDFGVKNTIDTKFNLGSMNKMFTAVAIMQLVEAGKVSLEDTLGKYVRAGQMRPDVLSKVRVKHLLTHTSGLGSYFSDEWDRQSRALYRRVDDWFPLIKDEALAFEPGSRWAYSNTGMLVLGKVIESASGMDYFDYIREKITRPAGMTNTDAYDLDRVNPNLAVGYEPLPARGGKTEYRNNIFMHVIRGGPAGGGYSTVDDLTRFANALESGRLVSLASVRQLTSAKPELNSPQYGYGFMIEREGKIVGHGGGFPGINSHLDIYLDNDYTVAVMSNYSGGAQPVIERSRVLLGAIDRQTATP